MNEINKDIITWDDYNDYANKIYEEIKTKDITCIVSLNRGGNILATHLAYKLKMNNTIFLKSELYDPKTNERYNEPKITRLRKQDRKTLLKCKNILIVDDIYDSGASLQAANAYINRLTSAVRYNAVLVKKSLKPSIFDLKEKLVWHSIFYGKLDETQNWTYFPWDL